MANIGASITVAAVGPSNIPVKSFSSAFVVGVTPWGESNVVKIVTSFSDFLKLFGGLNKLTTLAADGSADTWSTETNAAVVETYHSVKSYFDEKGPQSRGVMYFVRAVKSSGGATAAVRTFTDGSNTWSITSKWKGDPGETTSVIISNQTSYAIITVANSQAGITEVWKIATLADAQYASKNSQLVTFTPHATFALPSTSTIKKLGNGSAATADAYDPTASDLVGTTSAAGVKTGLQAFNDLNYGTGMVWSPAYPGGTAPACGDATWRAGLKTHCDSYKRLGLVSATAGLTLSTVVSDQTAIGSTENIAYYWPRVWVANDNSQQGGNVLIGNEGAVAGLHARLDAQFNGPHKSGAGTKYPLRSVIDVERQSTGQELCDDAGSNTVADATSYVNTLRVKNNSVVVWGMRTQAVDERFRYIPASRVTALVYHSCFKTIEDFTFDVIDSFGNTFANLGGSIRAFLKRLWRDGVIYGQEPGATPSKRDAYQVTCDNGNNTPETIGAGELRVDVLIVPTPNAEQVRMNLNVAAPGSARGAA